MAKKKNKQRGMAADRGQPAQGEPSAATGSPTGQGGTASAPSPSGGSPLEEAVTHLQAVLKLWKENPEEVGPVINEFVNGIQKMQQEGKAAPTSGQPAPAANTASAPSAPSMAAQRAA